MSSALVLNRVRTDLSDMEAENENENLAPADSGLDHKPSDDEEMLFDGLDEDEFYIVEIPAPAKIDAPGPTYCGIGHDDALKANGNYDRIEYTNETWSVSDLIQSTSALIEEVSQILSCPASRTSLLLQHYEWDKDKLMDTLYDGPKDLADLLTQANIITAVSASKMKNAQANEALAEAVEHLEIECNICMGDFGPEEMFALEKCGHSFCKGCWLAYLSNRISTDRVGLKIDCPDTKCSALVGFTNTMNLIGRNPNIVELYNKAAAKDIVECNKLLCWCQSPASCPKIIRVQWVDARRVTCSCGYKFCYCCKRDWHDPLQCEILTAWLTLCTEDLDSLRYLNENSKPCPRCRTPCVKITGCDMMVCGNPNCRSRFCWQCGTLGVGNFSPLHICEPKTAGYSKDDLQFPVERIAECKQRYTHHKKLEQHEKGTLVLVSNCIDNWIKNLHLKKPEIQFMDHAKEMLMDCRAVLMFTCGFSCCLKIAPDTIKQPKFVIFINLFHDLEDATSLLSHGLEYELSNNFDMVKQSLEMKTLSCYLLRRDLLGHIYEGYANGWWDLEHNKPVSLPDRGGLCSIM